MPTLKRVTVQYDPTSTTLTLEPPSLSLDESDWVLWEFQGTPSGSIAHIFFPATRFGPFESLRLLEPGSILGEGKVDIPVPSVFPYRALVMSPTGALATGDASLTNAPQAPNTSPNVRVRCVQHDGRYTLEVEPLDLYLYTGDAATWHILGIPDGHFVTVVFYGTADPWEGPFTTFSQSKALAGAGPDQFLAVGSAFSGIAPELTYRIELRDEDGRLVDSKDPKIDNMGEPPTGTSPTQESSQLRIVSQRPEGG